MKRDVPVELLEEPNPVTNQDRQNRITNLVRQPATKAFARNDTASDEPDAVKARSEAIVDEIREIAGVELHRVANPRQLAAREGGGRFGAIRPSVALRLEIQRRLVRARAHHIAVDCLE